MALITTIGGPDSNSYGTLAEADAYFAARVQNNWDGSDSHKEMALIRAAQYLDNSYRGRWKGQRVFLEQALAWPRAWITDSDGYDVSSAAIPRQIKYAQFEAAYLIANGTILETTIDRAVKREQVGQLSVEYMDGASAIAQYPQITGWLTDLVTGGTSVGGSFGNARVVRS